LHGVAGTDAQLLVPRALALLGGADPAPRSEWAAGWPRVPLHAFLPWAAQMLSLLDSAAGEALLPTLAVRPAARTACVSPVPLFSSRGSSVRDLHRTWSERLVQALARAHKQSLALPFGLSRAHYGDAGRRHAAVLEPLLADAALQRLAAELHALILPQQRWQGWQQQLDALITDGHNVRGPLCRTAQRTDAGTAHQCA